MPSKEFLEIYPLYKKYPLDIPSTMDKINKPKLNFDCASCESSQTYSMSNEYYYMSGYINRKSADYNLRCTYECGSCGGDTREFFIKVSDDYDWVMKIGQIPPWEIRGNKNIEKMLGHHKNYLSQGLICESQGYGIAAFSYYRRITEEIIDQLIGEVEGLIPENEREDFNVAFEKVKKTRQASEKIELVKDVLPRSLQIDGYNPLALLHSSLSEGLHAESDEECLKYAESVREILVYLVTQISEVQNAKSKFTEKMRNLLEKKS